MTNSAQQPEFSGQLSDDFLFPCQRDAQQRLSVSRVRVTTGERWEGKVEVTSGLEAGDQVVVSGQLKLSDGMQVEPVAHDTLRDDGGQAS